MSTFENCPLKYKYHYLDKLSPEEELEGIEAFLGSRFHETMEWLYRAKKLSKIRSFEETLDYFTKIWKENWHEGVQIVKKDFDARDYFNHGRKMVENYYDRVFVNDDSTTIALEKLVLFDLGEGVKVRGFIDRLSQAKDGVYEVRDYKTSGYLPTQKEADEDRQLAFYQIAVQNDYKDAKKVKLVWHYVAFDKDVQSTRKRAELRQLKAATLALVKKISKAEEKSVFPAKKSALCDWCGFRNICPAWKHLIKVEFMPENQFAQDNGVQLATKYAELYSKQKELQEKLEELKQAIEAYAKKEGVEVIVGKDCRISVKTTEATRIPPKNSVQRQELEELVKKTGKWLQLSDLSPSLLKQALESGVFGDKTAQAIQKLMQTTQQTTIRLTKTEE
ncbi:PD-(D/E)XK nuclease family protein [Candidatus Micrarchaeota archaeon]|nr:PD-(D/E)XK nuclease family protein [Candidatus Micrarchaeota archaeon]